MISSIKSNIDLKTGMLKISILTLATVSIFVPSVPCPASLHKEDANSDKYEIPTIFNKILIYAAGIFALSPKVFITSMISSNSVTR